MNRVAYVLKKFPRLSETFILTELLALEERGVPLVVYSLRAPDDARFHPELGRLQAEIRYVQAGPFADALVRLGRGEADATRRAQRLATALEFATDPAFTPEKQPAAALAEEAALAIRVAELARADGITHFHAHFATIAARVACLAGALAGIPWSMTGHAKDIYRETVNFRLLDRLARSSAAFVTVCDANVRWLQQKLSPAGFARVRRVYNGIDLDAFGAAPRTGAPRGAAAPPVLLAIGRLVRKKGFHVLLDAAAALARRDVNFTVRIVGEGPDRAALEQQAATLGLAGRVTFCGPQPSVTVRAELAGATLFCLPCVPDDDGNQDALPTVLLEAMAAGVPCVSTDLSGIPEILAHGRAGVLVAPNDAGGLAQAVESLLADPMRRAALAAAALDHARTHFDRRVAARALAAVHGHESSAARSPSGTEPIALANGAGHGAGR